MSDGGIGETSGMFHTPRYKRAVFLTGQELETRLAAASAREERMRQIELGWTPEHDDNHARHHLEDLLNARLIGVDVSLHVFDFETAEKEAIQTAALALAVIEQVRRRAKQAQEQASTPAPAPLPPS